MKEAKEFKTQKRIMLTAVVLLAAAVVVLIIGVVLMQGEIQSLMSTLSKFKSTRENATESDKASNSSFLAHHEVIMHGRGKRVRLSRSQQGTYRCEPITVPFCQNMPYTMAQYPNLLNHQSQNDSAKLATQGKFQRLLKRQCSPDLGPFLCSVLAPPCNGTRKPVPPCKELCKRVMKNCRNELRQFGDVLGPAMKCRRHPKQVTSQCFNGSWPKKTLATGCMPMKITQCRAIHGKSPPPWQMQVPNYFGHVTWRDVRTSLNRFNALFTNASNDCSAVLAHFLCPMYAPACTGSKSVLPPCRELCLQTRSQCRRFINQASKQNAFQWPTDLKCRNFPSKGNANCFMGPSTDVAITTPPPSGQCEVLKVPLCKSVPYNMTTFPNYFNHLTQEEASVVVHQFWPLVQVKCSSDLALFLCSLYAPVCTEMKWPVRPCRALCSRVKSGCLSLLQTYGFDWPSNMACEKFPVEGDGAICLDRTNVPEVTAQPPRPTKTDGTCETVVDPICIRQQYKMTRLPNFFNHERQSEASREISKFYPVIQTNCSSELNFFLCSLYIPRCSPHKALPCKELCLRVRKSCRHRFREMRFKFPVSCSKLPTRGESPQCIDGSSPIQVAKTTPSSAGRCEELTIPLCVGLPHNTTMLPNILQHRTQAEAALEVHQFYPLVKAGCSRYLSLFLCSVYAPPCNEPRQPCRELCNRVRDGCSPLMRRFGFTWPKILACHIFPTGGTGANCIAAPAELQSTVSSTRTTPNQLAKTSTPSAGRCEALTIPLCVGLSHNTTMLPNIFKHRTQEEVALEVHQFFPLVKVGCSRYLSLFLCSVYAPPCNEPRQPCREVCDRVRDGCSPIMRKFAFSWPKHLACDKFPTGGNGTSCIGAPVQSTATSTKTGGQ